MSGWAREWLRGRLRESATGIQWVEAKGSPKRPAVHKRAPHGKELASPECQ